MPLPSVTGFRSTILPAATLLLLGTAGCAVGPDYEAPEFAAPDAWENAAAADMADTNAVLVTWWTAFNDTLLNNLMAEADDGNLDLVQAVGRLKEARAFRQIAGGDYWPQVGLDGGFTRSEASENGSFGGLVGAGASNPSSNWEFGLGASWELDVFGRVRRSVEAASAQVDASREDYRDVLVSLYADIATTYVSIRSLQTRLEFARNNVDSQRETMEVVMAREDAGLVSMLDVTRARSNLANTEATIPQLETRLEIERNLLALLLGKAPGAYDRRLAAPTTVGMPDYEVIVDLPANMLRRRPDVRRSERNLAAQTARIGVATADLYPSFSLAGVLSLEATDFNDLSKSGSLGWTLAPGVRWNLFAGGKIRGQIKVEEARTEQALAAYEQTVLRALGEVENALVAVRQEEMRLGSLQTAVEASQQSVELVHTQYIEGLTDFQNYLDAQRDLFLQQDQMAASMGQVFTNLANLNRALGGGWSLDDPDPDLPVTAEDMASAGGGEADSATTEEVN
jgi:NodT family efflux transporter outer membrane factor (OMF) lipoprotein